MTDFQTRQCLKQILHALNSMRDQLETLLPIDYDIINHYIKQAEEYFEEIPDEQEGR